MGSRTRIPVEPRIAALIGILAGLPLAAVSCGGADSDGIFSDGSAGSAGSGTAGTGGTMTGAGGATGGAAGSGTGGSAGGSAGAGGNACPDDDGDGETVCAGDCDDTDPNNFSGNTEVCGDNADNNCDATADENCGGLGTFVSELTGNDMNPGTQAMPVQTINQGIVNAQTIGGGVDVFVAEGTYNEDVTLVEGISIIGDHQCDTSSCSWTRGASATPSTIQNTDADGVLADDSITRATRLDGFTIEGNDGGGAGQGRAAVTLDGGSPTISNNVINGPDVTGGNFRSGRSQGLIVLAPTADPAGALIESNEITGGMSGGNSSIGLMMDRAQGVTGNLVAVVRNNRLRGGQGRNSNGVAAFGTTAGTMFVNNDIAGGPAGSGTSFGMAIEGVMTIDTNRINVDANRVGSCGNGQQNWCGGIASFSATADIYNNVIQGADAPNSTGVMLFEAEMPAGAIILNGNTIGGSPPTGSPGGGSRSAALVLRIGDCGTCGFNARIGRIRNNILVGGDASTRFAVYEDAPPSRTQEPEAFENNLLFLAGGPAGNDALYREWDGSSATLHTMLGAVNGMTIPQSGPVAANIEGDPMLGSMGHVGAGSPAINAGTATEAPALDLDGETRPQGSAVDIGADEAG